MLSFTSHGVLVWVCLISGVEISKLTDSVLPDWGSSQVSVGQGQRQLFFGGGGGGVQHQVSWLSPLTRRYLRKFLESRIRAFQCCKCPAKPPPPFTCTFSPQTKK